MFALGACMAQITYSNSDSVTNIDHIDWDFDEMHALTPVLHPVDFGDVSTFQIIDGEMQKDLAYYKVESEWEDVFIVQRGKPVEARFQEVYFYDFTGKLCQTIIYYEY